MEGKKLKRLRLDELHSDQSMSDEDIPLKKRLPHHASSNSDLESYDTSSIRGKEPTRRRPYITKYYFTK